MPYGPEIRTGEVFYKAVVQHSATGVLVVINVEPTRADGSTPTEAQRDAVFQGLLNKLSELSGATIVSAAKGGNFTSNVTPA